MISNEIDFKENLDLPTEEELAFKAQGSRSPDQIRSSNAHAEFGMSGQEIRALENEIKTLKIENLSQDKSN